MSTEVKETKRRSKIQIDPNNRIVIKGAREHNLKNVDLTLPRNPEFARRDLCEDLSAKTASVEGVKK